MKKFFPCFIAACLIALFSVLPGSVSADFLSAEFSVSSFTDQTGMAYPEKEYTAELSRLEGLTARAEELFSPEREGSDVYRINHAAGGEKITVDEWTMRLILVAKTAYEKTGGAFDPALYPLVKLWGFSADHEGNYSTPRKEPEAAEISRLLQYADFSLLKTDEKTLTVEKPYEAMQLDFGGIVKGFILDEWAKDLPQGANALATVSLSSTAVIGKKYADGLFRDYQIGINDPRSSANLALVLSASDSFLSTSGDYERYYLYNGKRYCHVLDRKTGKPTEINVMSATAVCGIGALSDAFSTALMTLPLKESKALCEREGVQAVLIAANGEYYLFGGASVKKSTADGSVCNYKEGTELPEKIVAASNVPVWKYVLYGVIGAVGILVVFMILRGDGRRKK